MSLKSEIVTDINDIIEKVAAIKTNFKEQQKCKWCGAIRHRAAMKRHRKSRKCILTRSRKEKEQAIADTKQAILDHDEELNRLLEAHRVKLENLKVTIEKSDAAIKKHSKPLKRRRKVKNTVIHTNVEQ
jgi:hypothetical protein